MKIGFDDKMKELDLLVKEASEKRLKATKELNEINSWIKWIR